MKIGDVVFNGWQGFRRYGVVAEIEQGNNWKYCIVNWVNDEKYDDYVKYVEDLRSTTDFGRKRYRVDELVKVDVDHELKTLKSTQKLTKNT